MVVEWKKEWTGIWKTLWFCDCVMFNASNSWCFHLWMATTHNLHFLLTKRAWERCWRGYGMTRQIVKNSGMFWGRFVILPQVEWSDMAQMHEADLPYILRVPIIMGISVSHLGSIDCSTIPSGKTTANEAYFLQRSRCINLGNWDFSYHRVFREGARIGKVIYCFSLAGKSTGTISHQAGMRLSLINEKKYLKNILNWQAYIPSKDIELIFQKENKNLLELYTIVVFRIKAWGTLSTLW